MNGERCSKKNECSNYPNECNKCGALSDLRNFYPCFQDKNIVKVVRCRDCVYCRPYDDDKLYCHKKANIFVLIVDADDYCSYGERREE